MVFLLKRPEQMGKLVEIKRTLKIPTYSFGGKNMHFMISEEFKTNFSYEGNILFCQQQQKKWETEQPEQFKRLKILLQRGYSFPSFSPSSAFPWFKPFLTFPFHPWTISLEVIFILTTGKCLFCLFFRHFLGKQDDLSNDQHVMRGCGSEPSWFYTLIKSLSHATFQSLIT